MSLKRSKSQEDILAGFEELGQQVEKVEAERRDTKMMGSLSRKAQKIYSRLMKGAEVNFKGLEMSEAWAILDMAENEWRKIMGRVEKLEKDLALKRQQGEAVLATIQAAKNALTLMEKEGDTQ